MAAKVKEIRRSVLVKAVETAIANRQAQGAFFLPGDLRLIRDAAARPRLKYYPVGKWWDPERDCRCVVAEAYNVGRGTRLGDLGQSLAALGVEIERVLNGERGIAGYDYLRVRDR